MAYKNKYKILVASAEVMPFAKTGGLADVAGSLPKYLAGLGNDVRIVMPHYKTIETTMKRIADFPVRVADSTDTCTVSEHECECSTAHSGSIPVYFIGNEHYFGRHGIYGHFDDDRRFAFFCKAILEMLPQINFQPDIIHLNDWHTGPVCMLLKEAYASESFYSGIRTLFTVHNLQYQGVFPKSALYNFDVPEDVFTPEKVEFYGSFSFIKAGLCYADIINTVSSVYAEEIKTPEYGAGLDGLLRKRSDVLYGITNGIDYSVFDPSSDPDVYQRYDAENALSGKKSNKSSIQEEMGLPISGVPIVGLISRLTGQKGLNIILDSFDSLMACDLQFVLLGTGDEYYETAFRSLSVKYRSKFGLHLGFNNVLASRIYAGSDMFLMPSCFEPCGLGQLISLRYGTVPIVRATGGLKETITDYDAFPDIGNGFSFEDIDTHSMMDAIKRALRLFNDDSKAWNSLVTRTMRQDFSWRRAAGKYMELYSKLKNSSLQKGL